MFRLRRDADNYLNLDRYCRFDHSLGQQNLNTSYLIGGNNRWYCPGRILQMRRGRDRLGRGQPGVSRQGWGDQTPARWHWRRCMSSPVALEQQWPTARRTLRVLSPGVKVSRKATACGFYSQIECQSIPGSQPARFRCKRVRTVRIVAEKQRQDVVGTPRAALRPQRAKKTQI
jgi:hypothetical protein